jgi:lysophospholipase L1-like esterase
VTYVALGDSLTAGTGAQQYDEMFPYIVASDIAQKHKNVQYINYGTPGAKTIDVLDKQLFKTVDAAPDYVTVLIGVNDIHDRVSVDEFRANYDLIVKTLTTLTKAHVTVINIPYLGGRGLILPPYQWYFDTQTQKYNTVIEEIAGKYPVQVVDLYGETKDMFVADQSLYSSDLFHPSTKGYASWSNIILKDIK